jgi:hypothetical protein
MTHAPSVPLGRPVAAGAPRRFVAALLRRASVGLALVARRLHRRNAPCRAASLPVLEFHADAGAPEGALYVDGVLFGHVDGVTRL